MFFLILQEFEHEASFKGLYKTTVPQYTVKCLELCWLMNMHNPPVALGLPPTKNSKFDGNAYKEYTRTGETVNFVVWLPLLLHRNGPLLQKGVLQPNPPMGRSLRQKPHSAPANLLKSRHNQKEPSDIGDPQADHLYSGGRTTQEPSIRGTNQERGKDKYLYGNPYQPTVSTYQQNTASPSPNSQLADQRTQFQPVGGTSHEIGTAKYLYGDSNKSPVSSYQQNKATPAPSDYTSSTDRHDKSSAITKSGSSKTSKGLTFEYDTPYKIEHNGRFYVRFQNKLYTPSQWEEHERNFWAPGSSTA